MVQLENLQLVANVATTVVNAHGPLIINRLDHVPAPVQDIALHGVRHGAAVSLAMTQV